MRTANAHGKRAQKRMKKMEEKLAIPPCVSNLIMGRLITSTHTLAGCCWQLAYKITLRDLDQKWIICNFAAFFSLPTDVCYWFLTGGCRHFFAQNEGSHNSKDTKDAKDTEQTEDATDTKETEETEDTKETEETADTSFAKQSYKLSFLFHSNQAGALDVCLFVLWDYK